MSESVIIYYLCYCESVIIYCPVTLLTMLSASYNSSCIIAWGNMAVSVCPTESSMVERLVPLSHVYYPTSRHTASPCHHQASFSSMKALTNPTQMLHLLKRARGHAGSIAQKSCISKIALALAFFFYYCC